MPATNENENESEPEEVEHDSTPFRGACLTIHGGLPTCVANSNELPKKLAYFAFALEVGKKTGKKHWQCFAYSIRAMRFTGWKKIFPEAHIERMRGTFAQNEKYCSKEGKLTELGTRPMENGKKRKLQDFCDEVVQGAQDGLRLTKIIKDTEHKDVFVQYNNGISKLYNAIVYERLREVDANFAPEVTYIYGSPGCGKTTYVQRREPDLYECPENNYYGWKDGYCGQEAVLYDNVRLDNFKPVALLKEIDRYFIQVPVKGGFVGWRPKRIYITSLFKPKELAEQGGFDHPDELKRRLTYVINMDEKKGITL